jgi:Tfp pilus assembly protein PilO
VATEKKAEISTNNLIAITALVSLIVIILTVVIGRNLFNQLTLNNRVLDKKNAASKQVKENLEAIPELTRNYENLGARGKLISNSLPSRPDYPALISALEIMAGTSGVRLMSMTEVASPNANLAMESAQPGDTGTPSSTEPTPMQVNLESGGNYTNLLSFFKTMELSSRPMRMTSLQLKGTTTALRASAAFTTYYQEPVDLTPKTEVVK